MTKEEIRTDNTDVIANACKKIEELEKENAELKEVVINMNKVITVTFSNLTKAKEYITEFMRISSASVEEYEQEFSELIGNAEQFLKEIEK